MAGKLDRKRIITYVGIGFALALMTGLVSESVTIYKLFCAATGAAGTTGRAQSVALPVSDRTIEVRFDANIDKALPWEFKPPSKSVIVHLGQPTQVEFFSRNLSNEPVVGRALYNVTPENRGADCI